MFVSALASKYYLYHLSNRNADKYVPFTSLYSTENLDDRALKVLLDCKLNFPEEENVAENVVEDNKKEGIPAVSKYSLLLKGEDTDEQKSIRRDLNDNGKLLVLLSLGNDVREEMNDNSVVVLDGIGCCSRKSLDTCLMAMKMQSQW
ncbi:hypothetical protein MP638_000796 [Amoeboaphelidium occidentale]|nr:hypothetical protein MP638_000796 [Amoeboaphelidium occidentale]